MMGNPDARDEVRSVIVTREWRGATPTAPCRRLKIPAVGDKWAQGECGYDLPCAGQRWDVPSQQKRCWGARRQEGT
eukprot:CAMPEP_0185545124 /NCGR_PEP_ID=MMETSP1381-20130426/4551_1 /TAXON_ID=298111 /ORGANISM="Pavlova sp., Strain CCMP459" /LENGTH=75 /DNA_ID=CAMNT_0028157409 /DNA_START=214 /DNA_END=441 /DNA_ORIENTATION=-